MQGSQMSKNVLAVVGRLCVSRQFRDNFFADPRRVAEEFVGPLAAWELQQIDDLGGQGEVPPTFTREAFVGGAKEKFDVVYSFYLCPTRPCPRGD